MDYKKQSLSVLLVVIIIVVVSFFYVNNSRGDNITASLTGSKDADKIDEKIYSSEVNYRVPRGNEIIEVKLTLVDEKIIDTSIAHSHFDNHSTPYMEAFDAGHVDEVVGINIDEVDLDIVSGASLTTAAFMSAVEDIKNQI